MSLPEISRRCLSCGAAVRAGARFCQQCGKVVGDEGSPPQAVARSAEGGASNNGEDAGAASGVVGAANESAAPTTRDAEAPREWVAPTREFSAFVEDLGLDKSEEKEAARAASDESPPDVRATEAGFDPAKTTPMIRPAETAAANSAARAAAEGSATVAGEGAATAATGGGAANAASDDAAAGIVAAENRSRLAGVREDARARAGRVRERARAAFDDAPEDASATFIVAAVVLFLVFLVFLFLSLKVIR